MEPRYITVLDPLEKRLLASVRLQNHFPESPL